MTQISLLKRLKSKTTLVVASLFGIILLIKQLQDIDRHQNSTNHSIVISELDNSTSYRIQLDYEGKCIGSSGRSQLEVVFCDPNQKQTFHFQGDGRVVFDETGKCLVIKDKSLLTLGDCSRRARFTFVNESYLQLVDEKHGSPRCISSINDRQTRSPEKSPILGNPVGLTHCDKNASSLNLIEETSFMIRRKALLLPPLKNPQRCDFAACGINKRAPPVKELPPDEITRCHDMAQCVTVVTKTARRPHLVLRLAHSIRKVKGYDLPIIAYDDGVTPHSERIMKKLERYPKLQYIIGDREDLGIALGRTLAVKLVKTKYFLLFDDDTILNNQTNIELLAEILDTTDASLVGGKVADNSHFAGYFRFTSTVFGKKPRDLYHYIGACYVANEKLVNFPSCMRCDTTTNVFMAKTADILEVGGWSQELKIREHKDLFLRLKAAGKKVVYCPDFTVINAKDRPGISKQTGYSELRAWSRSQQMRRMFTNIWNIDRVFEHTWKTFLLTRNLTLQESP